MQPMKYIETKGKKEYVKTAASKIGLQWENARSSIILILNHLTKKNAFGFDTQPALWAGRRRPQ